MCTVTFIPSGSGYRLAMNRDEKLARPKGLPAVRRKIHRRLVVYPSEPGGGTWIALNDLGVSLALINWYSVAARVENAPVSRGVLIPALSIAEEPQFVETWLRAFPLERINPFQLVGVFLPSKAVVEWRWDLRRLTRKNHRWRSRQWISSGFDEPGAHKLRSRAFRAAQGQKSAGSSRWLWRLHRSHSPQTGPFSTCMHRADAATVSYTDIAVVRGRATMRHFRGAPCQYPGALPRAAQ